MQGHQERRAPEVFIYQVSDHAAAYEEVESQAISYTAGVPPVAAAMLIAQGIWDPGTMVNVEELDPEPFIDLLDRTGLPTQILEIEPGSAASFDGTVRPIDVEVAEALATVTVSASDPMYSVTGRFASDRGPDIR